MPPKNSLSSRMWMIKEWSSKWELRWGMGKRKHPTLTTYNTLFSSFLFPCWSTNHRTEKMMTGQQDQIVTNLKIQDRRCLPASKGTVRIVLTGPSCSRAGGGKLPRDWGNDQGHCRGLTGEQLTHNKMSSKTSRETGVLSWLTALGR